MPQRFWLVLLMVSVWLLPLGPVPAAGAQDRKSVV